MFSQHKDKTICITGASGFIAGHTVKILLENGFDVRGTVRDPSNKSNDFLRQMAESDAVKAAGGKLTLFKANLLEPGSFDEAFKDVDVVIHMAAVVINEGDPWDVVRQGVDGAVAVGDAATKAKVPRMVFTSSVAAIINTEECRHPNRRGKPYDETEFRLDNRPSQAPYETEKTYSELKIKEHYFGELVIINPSFVFGPLLEDKVRSSMEAIRVVTNREYGAMCPSMVFHVIDVRDTAKAHVCACFSKLPEGVRHRRYICSLPETSSLVKLSEVISKLFPHLSPATYQLPKLMLGIMPKIDKRFTASMAEEWPLDKPGMDNKRILTELDGFKFDYTDVEKIAKDAVESLMARGISAKPPAQ